MSLVQQLPSGALDIVGDIHGEIDALIKLLLCLGYDLDGNHPEGRKLVFVGDMCDRGPDSPAVIKLVQKLVYSGCAFAILGNHEVNILTGQAKDGTGWFYPERSQRDNKYAPFISASEPEKKTILGFLASLPLALEREDLRIVHAAWISENIKLARNIEVSNFAKLYCDLEEATQLKVRHLISGMKEELVQLGSRLEDFSVVPPFLDSHAKHDEIRQTGNPLKIILSGVERIGGAPFYSSGRWRFLDRIKWWDNYFEEIPVVVGHYWRSIDQKNLDVSKNRDPDLFCEINPIAWHGSRKNVFCIDYSVGGRWANRKGISNLDFRLAALRWPEKTIYFDNGSSVKSSGFKNNQITK